MVMNVNGISSGGTPISLHDGGDTVESFVLGSGGYKIQENESGSKTLYRYNEAYEMWVQLQFVGTESDEGLAAQVTETLKNEFLKNALSGDIGGVPKHLLTSGEIGVTIPSTKEKEGLR